MRRFGVAAAICLTCILAVGLVAPAAAGTAEVLHFTPGCNVGWDDESADLSVGAIDGSCEIVNVRTGNGGYRLVLHGQIPPEWMDAFIADGSPRSWDTGCLTNFGFLIKAGVWEPMIFSDSVRHFTADGRMTEVCSPAFPD